MLGEERVRNPVDFQESAVLWFTIKNLILSFIITAVIILAMVFLTAVVSEEAVSALFSADGMYFILLVFLVFLLDIFVSRWYSRSFYETFKFALGNEFFFTRKGVVTPSYTLLPYKNIQDVHVSQSVFEKFFGIATVRVYTATFSARGSDFVPGLSMKNAEALKSHFFKRIKEVKQDAV